MDVRLFVVLARSCRHEAQLRSTYAWAKTHLPPDSRLRVRLGAAIEEGLVDEQHYAEALAEADPAVIDYYLDLFGAHRNNEQVQLAVEITIANECGVHYEALLGAGLGVQADSLADKIIKYSPTPRTFASLIYRARRAGAADVAARLETRAQSLGLTLPKPTGLSARTTAGR